MKDKLISKDLLSAVQKLVTSTRGKDINETLLTKLEPASFVIRDFFNITHFQSIVLATFIECGLRDKTVDTERLIDYFGKRMCVIADINEAIEELLERRLVFVNRQDFTCERKSDYNRNIRVQDIIAENIEIQNSPRIPIASVTMTRQLKQEEASAPSKGGKK